MLQNPDVWIIVTGFNEAPVLAEVLDGLASFGNIVFVDDCSSDQSYQIARKRLETFPSLTILRHAVNLGQGAAIETGLRYSLAQGAKFLVTFDADGQHLPESLSALIAPLRKDECDVTLGSRFCPGGVAENIPNSKKKFLWYATQFTRVVTGLKITDTHNGLRAFTAKAAAQLWITQNRMAHATQILEQIGRRKLRYREVPVRVVYTEYSVRKGQRMTNALNILWDSFTEFLWK